MEMTVQKLSLLPAGRCLVDQSALNTNLERGKLIDLPIWSYLIETNEGPILVDTGMPLACAEDARGYFGVEPEEIGIVPKMRREDGILQVLSRTGYQPEDLLSIVSTHWHFDHAGGNRLFPTTPILVQRAEYEAALNNPDYPEDCRDVNLSYRLIEGDYEVVPGVRLLFSPGHSPGHQSVWVETAKSGSILLTIDAAYTGENFEKEVPFAGSNPEQALESIRRLKKTAAEENAKVFYGHDPEQGARWLHHPEFY